MTIREYLDNPMGKGDSSLPNRKAMIQVLEQKYLELDRKKGKLIKMKCYREPLRDVYYFHLIIPSETDRDNTYDVVFRFYDSEKKHYKDLSISGFDVQMFTNTPSFAYTFAHTYKQNGLLIASLGKKLSRRMIQDPATVRNRFGIVNFDKYLYFGARYIVDSKRMNRIALESVTIPYNSVTFGNKIRSLDQIMKEYDVAAKKLRVEKARVTVGERPKKQSTSPLSDAGIYGNRKKRLTTKKTVKTPKTPSKPKKPIRHTGKK